MMSTDQSFVPDFARVENDALAGQLLASFWQPIALSQNYVAGKARRIKILGTHYTLYRGADGHMRLVQDRCPHRGTSLAYGWVEVIVSVAAITVGNSMEAAKARISRPKPRLMRQIFA